MGVEHPGARGSALPPPLFPTLHDPPQRSWVATPGQPNPSLVGLVRRFLTAVVIPLHPEGMGIGEWVILFSENFEGMGMGIGNSKKLCA